MSAPPIPYIPFTENPTLPTNSTGTKIPFIPFEKSQNFTKTYNLDNSQYDKGFVPSEYENPEHALTNWRADNQPWYDQMADIAIRLPISLVAKTGRTLGYIGGGLSGLSEGLVDPNKDAIQTMLDGAFNNDMAKFFSQANEESTLNDYAPIFQGDKYEEKNPLSKMFTTTFYATQGVDMAAFMISTMIPAGLAAKGLTLVLKTLGGSEFVAKLAADSLWAGKAGKVLASKKVMDGVTTVATGILSASVESVFESQQIYDDALAKGMNKDAALALSEGSYLANMVVLSISNTWEANQIFKGLNNTKKSVKGLLSETGDVAAKVGGWKDLAKAGAKKAGQGVLMEGFWEENAQFAIQNWQNDVLNGAADNTITGAFTNITKNLFTNLGKEEGWENILGGALMGVVMGGIGGVNQRKDEVKLANQYSKNFKEGYTLDKFRKNVTDLKTAEVEAGQKLLKKYAQLLSEAYNINVNEKGSQLQDQLAELNQDELFNYLQDQLLANLVHNYASNGMSDHLITKIEALRNPSEVDRLVFNRVGDSKEEIDNHLNDVKKQVTEHEEKYNQVVDNFGWQTVSEKDDKGVESDVSLYNTHAIYLTASEGDSQRKHLAILRDKNAILESKLIAEELVDHPGSIRDIDTILKEKLDTGSMEGKEIKKNKAQIDTLSKLLTKTKDSFDKLTNPRTARSHLKGIIASQLAETEALVEDPEKNLTPFEKGVRRLEELHATGKLFYNGLPGNFHRDTNGKLWFNPDDKSKGTQITEENYEEFLQQGKTREQLEIDEKQELEKNKQKAKIEAIGALINFETGNVAKAKKELEEADKEILEQLIKLEEELAKKNKLRKNATLKRGAIDKVIKKIEDEIATLESIKADIENSIEVLEHSIVILNEELNLTKEKYVSFDDSLDELTQLAEKIATKNVPEATQLVEDSKSLLEEIQNKILVLTDRLTNFKARYTELMKINEAAKILYKIYSKQFKNKYKGVFRILNRNVLEDIIENGIRPTYDSFQEFKDVDELKDFIYNNPGFLSEFTKILKNNKELEENSKELDFLSKQIVLTESKIQELIPDLKDLQQVYAEYVQDKVLLERIDNFFENYDRLSKKFNQVFKRLTEETIAKYKSYIGFTEQPIDNIQVEQEPSAAPVEETQYNGAKKDTAYSTANKSEINPIIDKIINNLPFEQGKYFFKLISTLNPLNAKYITKEMAAFDKGEVERIIKENKEEKYFPLKAVLVDSNGNDVLADENGNIGKGNPVVFNINTANYVKPENFNVPDFVVDFLHSRGDKTTKEEFLAFGDKTTKKKPIWGATTQEDLIKKVFSIVRSEVASFREKVALSDYKGVPVFVPVVSKSNGIAVNTKEAKSLEGAFVESINDIELIDIAINKKGEGERFNYVDYRLPDGTTKRVMSGLPIIISKDGKIITSQNKTLEESEVNLVIDLLDKALNTNTNDSKLQLQGTNGTMYYILPNKSTRGESLIERLLLWNSSVNSNPQYHISFHGHKIMYGWDTVKNEYFSIDTANLKEQANFEHFKQFLRNKYFNVNKTFLNRDVYEHPVGLTEDGKIKMEVHDKTITEDKVVNGQKVTKKLGAYEYYLVKSGKIQTTLPKLGNVQYVGMYLQYSPVILPAPTKPAPPASPPSDPSKNTGEKKTTFVPAPPPTTNESEPNEEDYDDSYDPADDKRAVKGSAAQLQALMNIINQNTKVEEQAIVTPALIVEPVVVVEMPATLNFAGMGNVEDNGYGDIDIMGTSIEDELNAKKEELKINPVPNNEAVTELEKNCIIP